MGALKAQSAAARLLPAEHGAWAMLIVPWAIGCGIAGRVNAAAAMVLCASIALFLAQNQLMRWWRLRRGARLTPGLSRRSGWLIATLGSIGLISSAPLLLGDRRPGILVLGCLAAALVLGALFLASRRKERALPGQLLAALGLTLSAPAAWYVVAGEFGRVALALWVLSAAYFVGAVWYVRMLIAARKRRAALGSSRGWLALAGSTLVVEALLVMVAGMALRLGALSGAAVLGFVPHAVQLIVDSARLDRPPSLKRVGILATVSSILFALLTIALA